MAPQLFIGVTIGNGLEKLIDEMGMKEFMKSFENYISWKLGLNEELETKTNKIGNKCKNIYPSLKELMRTNLKEIKNKWPKKIPKGIIHGDLFIDNIFFKKNKFYGYIDFYFACNDFLMYEIAICINALCFDKKRGKFIFNKKKSKNLIKGYSKIRMLSKSEKKSLNILCKGAALRYLLTRSYDYLNTPKNAIIKIKDPKEYIQKLKIHNKFDNFKNYYN